MMLWYLPRKYRPPILFKILLGIELPVTIALLALFGVASPDLYRTRLWQDGADNGFNSSPDDKVYAAANYRPYNTPKPWSEFTTNFNLVISVLSLFFMLVKAPLFILHVFYPPLSVFVHIALTVLYSISIVRQASSDMMDPKHPQPGAPWYLTKSCSVAKRPSNIGYCQQAKGAFACTVIMLAIFFIHVGYAVFSCLPTDETRDKQRRRLQRRQDLEDLKSLKSPVYPMYPPMTPGGSALPPMTPRTQAFNRLGGTTDLPLRNHFLPPEGPNSHQMNFSMPSTSNSSTPPPGNGPATTGTPSRNGTPVLNGNSSANGQKQPPMYFPPPPNQTSK
ncbi:uncharacterized protein PADG_01581 [Paracoccidioides brasiliensis Pb18]|uniref:MARVEL domain-containing protein n=1 Tax=Paracoccidioides brasiliensis (strain Pb18) TaxID=502780 RepID=C1G3R5_PARBD|nr:uncharacterized protein PADG_01581 [Paracoccidioides brasiliensis Pb18]EEH45431.2 hypothetical protein PADG_01581 [Paracoccidioides brasiliensis Pb18]